jgi:hypothetical protein
MITWASGSPWFFRPLPLPVIEMAGLLLSRKYRPTQFIPIRVFAIDLDHSGPI